VSPAILMIALTLGRSPAVVGQIYNSTPANPVLAVATVEWESRFKWDSIHRNDDGSHDWRYWQICDKYHNPYAYDVKKHIKAGGQIMTEDLARAHGNVTKALRYWNAGENYPAHVLAIYYKLKTVLAALEMQPEPQTRLATYFYEKASRNPQMTSGFEQILLYDNRKKIREVKEA
jgi:hypothetical protein